VVATQSDSIRHRLSDGVIQPVPFKVIKCSPVSSCQVDSSRLNNVDASTVNPIISIHDIPLDEKAMLSFVKEMMAMRGMSSPILDYEVAIDHLFSINQRASKVAAAKSKLERINEEKKTNKGKKKPGRKPKEPIVAETEAEKIEASKNIKFKYGDLRPHHQKLIAKSQLFGGYEPMNTDYDFYVNQTLRKATPLCKGSMFSTNGGNCWRLIRDAKLNQASFISLLCQIALEFYLTVNSRILIHRPADESQSENMSVPRFLWLVFSSDFPTVSILRHLPITKDTIALEEFDFEACALEYTLTEFVLMVKQLVVEAMPTDSFNSKEIEAMRTYVMSNFSQDWRKGFHSHRFTVLPFECIALLFDSLRPENVTKPITMVWRQFATKKTAAPSAFVASAPESKETGAVLRPQFIVEFVKNKNKPKFTAAHIGMPIVFASMHSSPFLPCAPPEYSGGRRCVNYGVFLISHMRRYKTATELNDKEMKHQMKGKRGRPPKVAREPIKWTKAKGKKAGKDEVDDEWVPEPEDDFGMDETEDIGDHIDWLEYWGQFVTPARLVYGQYMVPRTGTCLYLPASMLAPDPRGPGVFYHHLHNPAAISNCPLESVTRMWARNDIVLPGISEEDGVFSDSVKVAVPAWFDSSVFSLARDSAHNDLSSLAMWNFAADANPEKSGTHIRMATYDKTAFYSYNVSLHHFLFSEHCIGDLKDDPFFADEDAAFENAGLTKRVASMRFDMLMNSGLITKMNHNVSLAKVVFRAYINYMQARLLFKNEVNIIGVACLVFGEYLMELVTVKELGEGDAEDIQSLQALAAECVRIGERVFWAWIQSYIKIHCPSAISTMHITFTSNWDGYSTLKVPEHSDGTQDGALGMFTSDAVDAFFISHLITEGASDSVRKDLCARAKATLMSFKADGVPSGVEEVPPPLNTSDLAKLKISWKLGNDVKYAFDTDENAISNLVRMFRTFALTPAALFAQEFHHYHGSVIQYRSQTASQQVVDWGGIQQASPAAHILVAVKSIIKLVNGMLNEHAKTFGCADDKVFTLESILNALSSTPIQQPKETRTVMSMVYEMIRPVGSTMDGFFRDKIAQLPAAYNHFSSGYVSSVQATVAETLIQEVPTLMRSRVNVSARYIEEFLHHNATLLKLDSLRPRDLENGATAAQCLSSLLTILPTFPSAARSQIMVKSSVDKLMDVSKWHDGVEVSPWVKDIQSSYNRQAHAAKPIAEPKPMQTIAAPISAPPIQPRIEVVEVKQPSPLVTVKVEPKRIPTAPVPMSLEDDSELFDYEDTPIEKPVRMDIIADVIDIVSNPEATPKHAESSPSKKRKASPLKIKLKSPEKKQKVTIPAKQIIPEEKTQKARVEAKAKEEKERKERDMRAFLKEEEQKRIETKAKKDKEDEAVKQRIIAAAKDEAERQRIIAAAKAKEEAEAKAKEDARKEQEELERKQAILAELTARNKAIAAEEEKKKEAEKAKQKRSPNTILAPRPRVSTTPTASALANKSLEAQTKRMSAAFL
jgi:hypothetical protein